LIAFYYKGLHLADASIWISAAMSLAVFDISKAVENGVEITPEYDVTSGLIWYVGILTRARFSGHDTLAVTPSPLSARLRLALKQPLRSFNKIFSKYC
jgi:hypothetical protein